MARVGVGKLHIQESRTFKSTTKKKSNQEALYPSPLIKDLAFRSAAILRTTARSFATIGIRLLVRRHWVVGESSHTSSKRRFIILNLFAFRTRDNFKVIFINFNIFIIVTSRTCNLLLPAYRKKERKKSKIGY